MNSIIDQMMREAEPQEINFSPDTAVYRELTSLMEKYEDELKEMLLEEGREKLNMLVTTILKLSDERTMSLIDKGSLTECE